MALELLRSRLRRELRLYLHRTYQTPWDLVRRINAAYAVPQSGRRNAPPLGHRPVERLLDGGTATNANTLGLLSKFMVAETGLPELVFSVSDQTLQSARHFLRFAYQDKIRDLTKAVLTAYPGLYFLCGHKGSGPLTVSIIVDFDATTSLLLARAVLREGHGRREVTTTYLEGFVVPEPTQLAFVLRHADTSSTYIVRASDADAGLRATIKGETPKGGFYEEVWRTASVDLPPELNGRTRRNPLQTSKYFEARNKYFPLFVVKALGSAPDNIDLFRDNFDIVNSARLFMPDMGFNTLSEFDVQWGYDPIRDEKALSAIPRRGSKEFEETMKRLDSKRHRN